ncbi:probable methyltransferase PMT19 [Amborella trichopoda]|uniref:Methyltransferase type 11 domain-containing protein n=1 Tax=Amborella trichopoda TaxID=13333 RepID=W1PWH9_AMBTC|nr:probable methyltransferase PMT19 [Amborella trichopoda]ERN12141.1 hypothetical protein AMTR_s00191p00037430 [Amborella trichopoda]|eukprot:XP_006850560.1 probable methyltransferase PMT19 [Amborella trichopoda]
MGMGLNLVLVVAMVTTNILSLYHLSSTHLLQTPPPPPPTQNLIPDHLLRHLATIRATIRATESHLSHLRSSSSSSQPPPELLRSAVLSPVGSACVRHPHLLHPFSSYNYTSSSFSLCPSNSHHLAEQLLTLGCDPLPLRRCFSQTPTKLLPFPRPLFPNSSSSPLPDSSLNWSPFSCKSFECLSRFQPTTFDPKSEALKWGSSSSTSPLDLTIDSVLNLSSAPIRLGLDIGGGSGAFAAHMRRRCNATILTTTLDLDAPHGEIAALRGLPPLHITLHHRFPIFDSTMDLVHCGRAVNRWIPTVTMEFLFYDIDRVLRAGGLLWFDHFFCKMVDLDKVYGPLMRKMGYKKLRWITANKTDASGVRNGELFLTALLQKPARP